MVLARHEAERQALEKNQASSEQAGHRYGDRVQAHDLGVQAFEHQKLVEKHTHDGLPAISNYREYPIR